MKKTIILLVALLVTSCGTTAKFVYPSDSKNILKVRDSKFSNKKVAVIPFEDSRPNTNTDAYWVSYIPVVSIIGGWSNYERPDAAKKFLSVTEFQFTPSEDLAKAAVYSLRKSQLFGDAFFSFGGDKDKADYVLEGEIFSTKYNGRLLTYGLSVYGSFLWYLGLPAGTSNTEISLDLKLKDSKSGKVLWNKRYDKANSIMQGIYYRFGHDIRAYSEMMEEIMNSAISDIKNELK
jgi:hypothetical protein